MRGDCVRYHCIVVPETETTNRPSGGVQAVLEVPNSEPVDDGDLVGIQIVRQHQLGTDALIIDC